MTADQENACAFERAAAALVTLTGCSDASASDAIRRSWLEHHGRNLDAMAWLTSMHLYLVEARSLLGIPNYRRMQLRVVHGGRK